MKHTLGMSWLQLLGKHTKISLQFMFSPSLLTGVNLFILRWIHEWCCNNTRYIFLLPYLTQVMASAPMALFCSFFWQVFKASLTTDAFMFVRKLSLLMGSQRKWELLSVSQMLPLQHGGDSTGERGKPVIKYNSHMHCFQSFLFTLLGVQVLSSH